MLPSLMRTMLVFAFILLFAGLLRADDTTNLTAGEEKAARAALAKFEKGNGDWKARMGALVELARIGPNFAKFNPIRDWEQRRKKVFIDL